MLSNKTFRFADTPICISFEHRNLRGWSQWKASVWKWQKNQLDFHDCHVWIHGSKYTEGWDTYNSQLEKLRQRYVWNWVLLVSVFLRWKGLPASSVILVPIPALDRVGYLSSSRLILHDPASKQLRRDGKISLSQHWKCLITQIAFLHPIFELWFW